MSEFDTLFFDGFETLLVLHGEEVVYKPKGNPDRPIIAIVNRDQAEAFDEFGNAVLTNITIEVLDSETDGIKITELQKGQDKVLVSSLVGGEPQKKTIKEIVSQTGGKVVLELK